MPLEHIDHNCGLTMAYDLDGKSNVVPLAVDIAAELEHRGQDVAGIAYLGEADSLRVEKYPGHVSKVLRGVAETRFGVAALIHNRYKTSGRSGMAAAQPFRYQSSNPSHDIAIGHNGNIDPEGALAKLEGAGRASDILSDTDAIGRLLHMHLKDGKDIKEAVEAAWPELDGAHNIAGLRRDGSAFAWRDQRGMHPLVFGKKDNVAILASEDYAIRHVLGNKAKLRDVEPGELIELRRDAAPASHRIAEALPAHCIFEWWYFSHHLSRLDEVQVEAVRHRSGVRLAKLDRERWKREKIEPSVIPVPRSAMAIAGGYIHELHNLSRVDGIVRNEDAPRTFISEAQHRKQAVEDKYHFKYKHIAGEDIVLIDDSIVRGPTMRAIIEKLRDGPQSAKSVHVRIAFPPVLAPCFYGIDMSTVDELFMTKFRLMELDGASPQEIETAMAKELNADSVNFLPVAMVPQVLGIDDKHLCHGCTRAQYPTQRGQQRYDLLARGAGLKP